MIVLVNLDPCGGIMHTVAGTRDVIQETLTSRMGHYAPRVSILPSSHPSNLSGNYRKAFVVHIDLDPVPGDMHTEISAQACVKYVLSSRVQAYRPSVYEAPANLQPDYVS